MSTSVDDGLVYPILINATDILRLLPHRWPMSFIQEATVLSHDTYEGVASWADDNPLLQGHFPHCAVVPGALQLEAAAQLAGIGLLAGDPIARAIGPGHLGMLTAIRKCFFKRPVLPNVALHFQLQCRRMGELAVLVSGSGYVDAQEAVSLEFMVAHAPLSTLQEKEPNAPWLNLLQA